MSAEENHESLAKDLTAMLIEEWPYLLNQEIASIMAHDVIEVIEFFLLFGEGAE